jgi:hypothetical protein
MSRIELHVDMAPSPFCNSCNSFPNQFHRISLGNLA